MFLDSLFYLCQRLAELIRGEDNTRARALKPVIVNAYDRHVELRPPELPRGGDNRVAAGNDHGLRLAGQHLFAAHLRPGNGAVGKDIGAAAGLDYLILDRRFAGGEQRTRAELNKDAFFRSCPITRGERLPALFERARRACAVSGVGL